MGEEERILAKSFAYANKMVSLDFGLGMGLSGRYGTLTDKRTFSMLFVEWLYRIFFL
jgi:hypothetical protein